jgi:hypothetical protein
MHATRRLLSLTTGSGPSTLLAPPTITGLLSSACQGAWSLMVDEASRDAYEGLVKSSVIKDAVLSRATNGAILTYSLFHELQDPQFAQYKVDFAEFVEAAGPALENFHDALGRLRNRLAHEDLEQKSLDEKLKLSNEEILEGAKGTNLTETLLGVNLWRRQAEQDPDSLAGVLSRMTTNDCFDALFYTSKLDVLGRIQGSMQYEDSVVNDVALLGARAAILRDKEREYNEFQATDDLNKDFPVVAQMDLLFEVTHTFKAAASTDEKAGNDADGSVEEAITVSRRSDAEIKTETASDANSSLEVTNLAVAIFEGFLHGGPTKRLQWKIALIREAFEFPQVTPVMRK